MMRARDALATLLAASALAAATASTWSAWTDAGGSVAGTISAAADWQAPPVDAAVAGKSSGGSMGFVHQGGGYYVYANVTDAGNPASGTSAVSADAGSISTGLSAVPLSAGSFSAQGVAYNRRSALLTANATLAEGSRATTIATTDVAANSAVVSGPSVVVDNAAPSAVAVQIDNGGLIAGRPDSGDTMALDWSETLDPYSILAGWSGAAAAVQVVITDVSATDSITIQSSGGVALPLGTIALNSQYVTATSTFSATMVQSGASIVVTLGAMITGIPHTANKKATLTWGAGTVTGATDRAANALVDSTITESGIADLDF
jgi:hypothetical protein